ncbi:hypothetical protein GUITHDRAFT_110160 [Guillardia theta CCMP2712]|uniref:Histone-lysine N-methyltransferase, H3 lysine-79 specific n=1 Tax=Guillardia theta (strain CCMP2712) TaxID=905079 RepID=L1J588_GUITC|nr:hypothetical protein GUITHDRAFT_110160 [Guillardia theta CCMP2712]EKX43703.1 hypothetical protein GUITHDRAFT_110160 [Guillardia theta CCMP2712]|eukprot:XP_005830683.1 hypothetical protein GUITHDRAFT_110160 [Guillardia theta CCMP2712]
MAQSKGIVPKDGMEVIDQVETHVLVAGTKPEDAIQHLGSHTYGEISPSSFAEILCLVQPKEGEIFVDLGSGTGKAVLLAASLFPFSESIGIEFVEPLHKAALRLQQSFWTMVAERKTTFAATEIGSKILNRFVFWYDGLDKKLALNWTTQWHEMNDTLIKRMEKLRVGARAITMTRPLDLDKESWVLRHKIVREYGRGKMTFFLFEKFAMSPQKTAKDTR